MIVCKLKIYFGFKTFTSFLNKKKEIYAKSKAQKVEGKENERKVKVRSWFLQKKEACNGFCHKCMCNELDLIPGVWLELFEFLFYIFLKYFSFLKIQTKFINSKGEKRKMAL